MCCCCSPYIATIVAGVLGIFQAFASLCWNVPLLISLSLHSNRTFNIAPVDTTKLNDVFVVYGITAVFAFMNLQILIFSALMLKGNSAMRTEWLSAWFILINFKTIMYGFVGMYFFYKYGTVHSSRLDAYFRLGALFSGIFFFWPSVNLILSGLVCKRLKDIDRYNATGICPSTDMDIPSPTPRTNGERTTPPPPYTESINVRHDPDVVQTQSHQLSPNASLMVTGWSEEPLLSFEEQPDTTAPAQPGTINSDGRY